MTLTHPHLTEPGWAPRTERISPRSAQAAPPARGSARHLHKHHGGSQVQDMLAQLRVGPTHAGPPSPAAWHTQREQGRRGTAVHGPHVATPTPHDGRSRLRSGPFCLKGGDVWVPPSGGFCGVHGGLLPPGLSHTPGSAALGVHMSTLITGTSWPCPAGHCREKQLRAPCGRAAALRGPRPGRLLLSVGRSVQGLPRLGPSQSWPTAPR